MRYTAYVLFTDGTWTKFSTLTNDMISASEAIEACLPACCAAGQTCETWMMQLGE